MYLSLYVRMFKNQSTLQDNRYYPISFKHTKLLLKEIQIIILKYKINTSMYHA